MNKIYTLVLAALLALGFAACEDDDCGQFHIDTDMMGIPTVMKGSFPVGAQVVVIGDSIVFAPRLMDTTGVAYSWNINGKVVSTDSAFTFKVEKPCRAKLVCTLENSRGKVILESDIASKQDLTKGFFVVQQKEIGFYDEATKKLYADCYQSFNAGGNITNRGDIFVTQVNHRLYALENGNVTNLDNLVVVNTETLSKQSSMHTATGLIYFIPLDERYVILSSSGGIYRLDMVQMRVTKLASEAKMPIFNGIVFNGKLLVNTTYGTQQNVAYYDVKELIDAKEGYIPSATELNIPQNRKANFVQAKDGNVYTISSTGADYKLVKIMKDFTFESIALPFSTTKAQYWSTPYFNGLAASQTENALFIPSADNTVYKYMLGDISSLSAPFVTAPSDGSKLSGMAISVNPVNGELYVLYSNKICIFAAAGAIKQTIDCEESNPQAIIFNN